VNATDLAGDRAETQRLRALEATALLDSPAERIFDRLTELAASTLGVPIALISLVTADRQFFKSQCGLPNPVAEARETPLSHSFCQHVVHDEAPLVISDARVDARLRTNLAIPDLGVIAYAGVPLRTAAGAVIGSFCAIDTQPREWRDAELELLHALAATTMEIVALRDEAIASADVARRLQAALVLDPPRVEGAELASFYRSGERRLLLGGDFYFVKQTPDGAISLLIGDVAGHGPEAAGFAATLRSAWRTMLLAQAPLDVMVSQLNVIALDQQPSPSFFATALACAIAPDRETLAVCSAGHAPPVLIRDGRGTESYAPAGPPLGVVPDATWTVSTVPFGPGSGVLLYTDGLIEGRRAPGAAQRLGIAGLLEAFADTRGLTPAAQLAALADHAVAANGAPLSDDVAALLLTLP
jgi:phosphoserine phosphatase RsbU/P